MATEEQLQRALAKATAANDKAAVADLQQRLSDARAAGKGATPAAGASAPPAASGESTEPQTGLGKMLRAASYAKSLTSGVADAGIRGFIGLKQANDALGKLNIPAQVLRRALNIAPRDTTEEQGVLREQQKDFEADPNKKTRIGGNVAANVLATAIPFSRVGAIPGSSSVAGGAALSGATGMLLNPGQGDTQEEQLADKAKSSLMDAAFGAAGTAGAKVLQKALGGLVTPSIEAVRLMKEKIYPTVAQGAESGTGRALGSLTSGIYDTSRRQNKEVLAAYLKEVAPNLDTAGMTVPEITAHLKEYFQGGGQTIGEYEKLLGGKTYQMTPTNRSSIWQAAAGGRGMQSEAKKMSLQAMGGTGDAMVANNNVRMNFSKMMEYRNKIQDAIDAFTNGNVNERQAKQALIKAKDAYDILVRDPQLSAAEKQVLEDINQRYTDFLRFKDAAANPAFQRKPNVNELQKAYASADPEGFAVGNTTPIQQRILDPSARVMGLVPRQDEARSLVSAVKRASMPIMKTAGGVAAVGAAPVAMAPLYGLSALSQTKPGARLLFGDYGWQKPTAEEIEKLMPYIMGSGYTTRGEQ